MPKVKEDYKKSRKQQILKAAYNCFNKRGYHNTSMRDIFKEAKLSSGAVYNYYPSKEDILQELVLQGQNSSKKLFDEIISNAQIKNPLRHILEYYFDQSGNKTEKLKGVRSDVSIWAAALVDENVMKLTQNSYKESTNRISEFIEKSISQDKLKDTFEPKSLALLVISLIEGLAIQKMLNPEFNMGDYTKAFLAFINCLEK